MGLKNVARAAAEAAAGGAVLGGAGAGTQNQATRPPRPALTVSKSSIPAARVGGVWAEAPPAAKGSDAGASGAKAQPKVEPPADATRETEAHDRVWSDPVDTGKASGGDGQAHPPVDSDRQGEAPGSVWGDLHFADQAPGRSRTAQSVLAKVPFKPNIWRTEETSSTGAGGKDKLSSSSVGGSQSEATVSKGKVWTPVRAECSLDSTGSAASAEPGERPAGESRSDHQDTRPAAGRLKAQAVAAFARSAVPGPGPGLLLVRPSVPKSRPRLRAIPRIEAHTSHAADDDGGGREQWSEQTPEDGQHEASSSSRSRPHPKPTMPKLPTAPPPWQRPSDPGSRAALVAALARRRVQSRQEQGQERVAAAAAVKRRCAAVSEERVNYHVLYWESANFDGIRFGRHNYTAGGKLTDGPTICSCCEGVVDPWRFRVENSQSSVRMCLDASGERFRADVQDFVCLSPRTCLEYRLRQFHCYIAQQGHNGSLGEEAVLGATIRTYRGEVREELSGISVTDFGWVSKDPDGNARHMQWVREYVRGIRKAADGRGGVSIGLMLDVDGSEMGSFGIPGAMFGDRTRKPILEVVILLGGPMGIEESVLPHILEVFNDRGDGGFHEGTAKVRLPGGKHHSYVALGELLSFHDRGFLVPVLEDHRTLGADRYGQWYRSMSRTMAELAKSTLDLPGKRRALLALLGGAGQAYPRDKGDVEDQDDEMAEEGEADEATSLTTGAAIVTPCDVHREVAVLEAHGLLPRPRPWRARLALLAIEPVRALAKLREVERALRKGFARGVPVEDPWNVLAASIDRALEVREAGDDTQQAVMLSLSAQRDSWGECPGSEFTEGEGLESEARALGVLPCEEAKALICELTERPPGGFRLAAERRAAELLPRGALQRGPGGGSGGGAAPGADDEAPEAARPWSADGSRRPQQPSHPPPWRVSDHGSPRNCASPRPQAPPWQAGREVPRKAIPVRRPVPPSVPPAKRPMPPTRPPPSRLLPAADAAIGASPAKRQRRA